MKLATKSCLQSYIRYVCVYSGITCTGRLVKSCKMYYIPSLMFFCCFFPPKKRLFDQVSDREKTWQDDRKVARLWSVCVLKEGILHIFNFQS